MVHYTASSDSESLYDQLLPVSSPASTPDQAREVLISLQLECSEDWQNPIAERLIPTILWLFAGVAAVMCQHSVVDDPVAVPGDVPAVRALMLISVGCRCFDSAMTYQRDRTHWLETLQDSALLFAHLYYCVATPLFLFADNDDPALKLVTGYAWNAVDGLAAMTMAASTYQLSRKNPDDGLQCAIVCGLNLPMLVLIIEGVSRKRAYGSDPSTDGSLALMSDYLAFGLSMFSSLCPLIRQNFLPRQSDVLKDTSDICDMAITTTDPNPAVYNI